MGETRQRGSQRHDEEVSEERKNSRKTLRCEAKRKELNAPWPLEEKGVECAVAFGGLIIIVTGEVRRLERTAGSPDVVEVIHRSGAGQVPKNGRLGWMNGEFDRDRAGQESVKPVKS